MLTRETNKLVLPLAHKEESYPVPKLSMIKECPFKGSVESMIKYILSYVYVHIPFNIPGSYPAEETGVECRHVIGSTESK